jgi:Putative mono-oxygenase ydhR
MIVAIVRFALPTPLSVDQARTTFEPGAPAYQTIPGLRRKHYLLSDDGIVAGGVYLWDSREQAEETYNDAWRERLTKRYGASPTVEYFISPLTVDPTSITTD